MAYTKTVWAAGDTVTSQKLNKIENQLETLSNGGAGGGCLWINMTETQSGSGSLDKASGGTDYELNYTFNEIKTAMQNGLLPVFHYSENISGGRSLILGDIEILGYLAGIYDLSSYNSGGSSPKNNTKLAGGEYGDGFDAPYCVVVYIPYGMNYDCYCFGADDPANDTLTTGYESSGGGDVAM